MADLKDGQVPPGPGSEAPGSRAGSPAPPGTFRVDVRESMGVDAGPWTIAPDDSTDATVRWLDPGRAVVASPAFEDGVAVALGETGARDRRGRIRREVVVGGWRILLDVEPERTARLREYARRGRAAAGAAGPTEVRAVIPGRIVGVSVGEGDTVEAGQQLLVVEAMKMQNEIQAPRAGIVERVAVGVGQAVELGAVLLVIA
jgi:biotin carboxyl carrier protein